ncbi:MAG: DNA polymerase I [Actinobacteria bacterium]|nr:DNA polymerase I [Actinomycetota bacterium]
MTADGRLGLAFGADRPLGMEVTAARAAQTVEAIEERFAPRFVMWNQATAATLLHHGIPLARSWDIAATFRLLHGSWQADEPLVWAHAHGLDLAGIPRATEPDLFNQLDPELEASSAVDGDGYLRPTWAAGAWQQHAGGPALWAQSALDLARRQRQQTTALPDPTRARATIRSESSVELLCAELSTYGLPISIDRAHELLTGFIGPPPSDEAEELRRRAERDGRVLDALDPALRGEGIDLRSPGQVKTLLRRAGFEVPDTRSWTLKAIRDEHPLIEALLWWRKTERLETTYGYRWLAANVSDGRLRGQWTGCDGAAGRMTASAGLHSLPAELRDAVRAEPGHVFVRADLGQIEPRVLAAISGDPALQAACADPDLYTPVATALGVERDIAKVAVLGAMYGQTTGKGAEALWRLKAAYPIAMAYLETAADTAAGGRDLRTFGGRLIRLSAANANEHSEAALRSQSAARGRFGRNAMVQGAAAEFFKIWALMVRAQLKPLGAQIVLCLHDELLCHVPVEHAAAAAALVDAQLVAAGARWFAGTGVRFVADTSIIASWADAKG